LKSLSNTDIFEPFRFVSTTPKWFPSDVRLTLSSPDVVNVVLETSLGQPNPLGSRPGPQRLFVQIPWFFEPKSLLLAGAFSRDTQFF
uniref:Tub domain-containing protein n=1 Tax=Echinostoma caproni TaxID=27848 RepID=A0A183B1Q5_9TREM